MWTILFAFLLTIFVFKLGWFAFKAAWGIVKIVFSVILFPIFLIVLVACGFMYLALPLLIIVGIVFLIRQAAKI